MGSDSPFTKAYSYLSRDKIDDEIIVKPGTYELFHYSLYRIVDEELNISVDEKRISYDKVVDELEDLIFEVKKEDVEGKLSDTPAEEFERRRRKMLSDLLSRGMNEYTFVFPLNVGLLKPKIQDMDILDTKFQRISQETWKNDYLKPAKEKDKTFLKKFLRVSPNDFLDDLFTYYKVDYEARSSLYAVSRVLDLANMVLGKLNYCLYENVRYPPNQSNETALPHETWADIKEPSFYLIFEDEYLFTRPMDYGYRRTPGTSERRIERVDQFYDLPKLSKDDPVDADIYHALMAFQDGMTESSTRKSFFSFWRGAEILSQVGPNKEEVTERGRFALEYVLGDQLFFPEINRAHNELYQVRSSLAHEGVHISVKSYHESYCKVLLDSMIRVYFEKRGEFDQEDFAVFFEYGAEYINGVDKMIDILNELS